MAKLQCDFSAMIGPEMFGEFMVPVLDEMTRRLDYSMYHWDGPGAIPHLDHLLSIENLDIIQWTPGAGEPPTWDKVWWPLYHRCFDGGKKVDISASSIEQLAPLKKEFGPNVKNFHIGYGAESKQAGEDALAFIES
jgi:hypothetical protein